MALHITEVCVNCWACVTVCPNTAIFEDDPVFAIDPRKCTECAGEYAEPQCAAICPIECAIVDELGEALNPLGSLSPSHPAAGDGFYSPDGSFPALREG
ncbi:MAG: 4Fe-4S dicluster domain-containing protein [Zoogloeaceae bacterium]|jgi:ferredoxin|nr:4Fe-4S dicluster domain-containing protein [Zoogloeaceae bacterium]